jgi:hypothetical protein
LHFLCTGGPELHTTFAGGADAGVMDLVALLVVVALAAVGLAWLRLVEKA